MNDLQNALQLKRLPVAGLTKVRDLESFDGPLLSHFAHPTGDQYLYYWCDSDGQHNRWMVLRVSETNIVRLVNRFVPLDFVVPKGAKDDFVYFVDHDGNGKPIRAFLVMKDNVPDEYQPEKGAHLDGLAAVDARSYTVLIEGRLSPRDLFEMPRKYSQVYAFVYTLDILKPGRFEQHPWRDGYSAMHFNHALMDFVPGEDRPEVDTVQYASPGFIRFKLHQPTAAHVAKCVSRMAPGKSPGNLAYSALAKYINEHDLNALRKTNREPLSDEWQRHAVELLTRTAGLLATMLIDDVQSLFNASPDPFEAAKIALWFGRRVRELARFEDEGIIRLPSA